MSKPVDGIKVRISDDEIKGRYSNLLRIAHTREEFVLDFMNFVPPQAIVVSRIVTNPGHLKRIVAALEENLRRYEEKFGAVEASPEPVRPEDVN